MKNKKSGHTFPSKIKYDRRYNKKHKKIALRLHREDDKELIEFLTHLSKEVGISQQQVLKNLLSDYYSQQKNSPDSVGSLT